MVIAMIKRLTVVPGFFALAFFSEFVAVELFLVDLYDFYIAPANEHPIFTKDHFCELSGYLNNCLPRKFPLLKYQT